MPSRSTKPFLLSPSSERVGGLAAASISFKEMLSIRARASEALARVEARVEVPGMEMELEEGLLFLGVREKLEREASTRPRMKTAKAGRQPTMIAVGGKEVLVLHHL